jgi:hypothetical protein
MRKKIHLDWSSIFMYEVAVSFGNIYQVYVM